MYNYFPKIKKKIEHLAEFLQGLLGNLKKNKMQMNKILSLNWLHIDC